MPRGRSSMPRFNRLRVGTFGNAVANLLTFLTTNWHVVVSIVAAIAAGAIDWLRAIALNPGTIAGVGAFLVVLWTIIGITLLIDRRRPREVRTAPDYRYGLTFEGFQPRYVPLNSGVPSAGDLGFAILTRNYLTYPLHYDVEHIDIRLGTRALPKIRIGTLSGFMSRAAGRTNTIKGFTQNDLKEFYGKGTTKGTVEFSIAYGPAEEAPVKRLKMELEFYVVFSDDGLSVGWQDGITSESDELY